MAPTILHLRAECKPLEHRSALTPSTAQSLIHAGYTVNVERCTERIFDDVDFERVGAKLVPNGSWPDVPQEHIIIGLKELPELETFPLKHTHVQFAHCYKRQGGWENVLSRFPRGGGTLLDLEFLEENGRRVAAFGYHAGFAGAALATQAWSWQLVHGKDTPMKGVKPYNDEGQLLAHIKSCLEEGEAKLGRKPRALVMGALGRCGRGAVDLLEKIGVPSENIVKWDMAETAERQGPYQEIVESDIFVNCIYLSKEIPPFLNSQSLAHPNRKLAVICDVSCDTTNPHNPIPVYSINTTFGRPTVPVEVSQEPTLTVISIDHLPSLMPREASEAFSQALLPYLLQLKDWHASAVWEGAYELFKKKCAELPSTTLAVSSA